MGILLALFTFMLLAPPVQAAKINCAPADKKVTVAKC